MDSNARDRWVLVGSTVAGAVGGGVAVPRLGAALGPWGVAAGALIGALVGASAASLIVGDVEFPTPKQPQHRLL